MPQVLTQHGRDRSTYVVQCDFEDEDGNAIAPATLAWALYDTAGNVINSHSNESVATPSATEHIVLEAADMDIDDGSARLLVVNWTYNSTYGTDLESREEIRINIDDIIDVAV